MTSRFAALASDSDSEPEETVELPPPKPEVDFMTAPITAASRTDEGAGGWETTKPKRKNKKRGKGKHRGYMSAAEREAHQRQLEEERRANTESFDRELANASEAHKHSFKEVHTTIGGRAVVFHGPNPQRDGPKNLNTTLIRFREVDHPIRNHLIRGFETVTVDLTDRDGNVMVNKDGSPRRYTHHKLVHAGMTVPKIDIKLFYYHPVEGEHDGAFGLIYNSKFVKPADIATAVDECLAVFDAIMAEYVPEEPAAEPESVDTGLSPIEEEHVEPEPKPVAAAAPVENLSTWKPASGMAWADMDDSTSWAEMAM